MKLTDVAAVIGEPIKQSIMVQRLEIDLSEETKNFLLKLFQVEPEYEKCVARIEVDTEEVVKRIKEEYDITDGWIPCSERLPNKKDLYMVTLKTFSDDYRFIDLLYYGKPLMPNCKVKGVCWYRSDSEWGDVVYDDTDILAWMPLPMPYREDGEV